MPDGYGALGGPPRASDFIALEGGPDVLAARTPVRFQQRVAQQFASPENVAYLERLFAQRVPPGPLRKFALDTLDGAVQEFAASYGRGYEVAYSDPLARRGGARPAGNLWAEIRRLNLAFFEQRNEFIVDKAALITGSTDDGQWDDDEDYATRMFQADSLRPPGMEHLNDAGPLYSILEDRTQFPVPKMAPARAAAAFHADFTRAARGGLPRSEKEGFSAGPYGPGLTNTFDSTSGPKGSPMVGGCSYGGLGPAPGTARYSQYEARVSSSAAPVPGVDPDDWGWTGGRPNRTAEEAISEYWGDGAVESTPLAQVMTTLGAMEVGGPTFGDRTAWGDQWRENGGTRAMRRPEIPFYQNLSRGREYDRDIRETIGSGTLEFDSQVRAWDTQKMRDPRGEEYRRYGPRSSSTGPSGQV